MKPLTTIALGGFILVLSFSVPVMVGASGTKVSGGGAKPADMVDKGALESRLLPEGKKIVMDCTLETDEDGRYRVLSRETERSYKVLENSLLEEMIETVGDGESPWFRITARVTEFRDENYVFITKVGLAG